MAEERDGDIMTDIRLALVKLTSEVSNLVQRMDAMEKNRDKDTQQLLVLLQPRLEAIDKNQERQAEETKGLGARVDRDLALIEARLTKTVSEHLLENAPHDTTVGSRLGRLENALSMQRGALAVLGLFSPLVAALLTKYLGG